MAQWPPLPMKDVVDGHERSISPRPPEGEESVMSRFAPELVYQATHDHAADMYDVSGLCNRPVLKT